MRLKGFLTIDFPIISSIEISGNLLKKFRRIGNISRAKAVQKYIWGDSQVCIVASVVNNQNQSTVRFADECDVEQLSKSPYKK